MSKCPWCFTIEHHGQLRSLTQLYMPSWFQFGITGDSHEGGVLKCSKVSFGGCGGVHLLIHALALVVHAYS